MQDRATDRNDTFSRPHTQCAAPRWGIPPTGQDSGSHHHCTPLRSRRPLGQTRNRADLDPNRWIASRGTRPFSERRVPTVVRSLRCSITAATEHSSWHRWTTVMLRTGPTPAAWTPPGGERADGHDRGSTDSERPGSEGTAGWAVRIDPASTNTGGPSAGAPQPGLGEQTGFGPVSMPRSTRRFSGWSTP